MNTENDNIALLVIDPQIDFTIPEIGSLVVPGGDDDMKRLSKFVIDNAMDIDRIFVTMDTHSKLAIFHPMFWMNAEGNKPDPFTAITLEDVIENKWFAAASEMQDLAYRYLKSLKANNRHYPLVVWPEHCLLGTLGWNVHPDLMTAFLEWEDKEFSRLDYVLKGRNMFTEMYSAIRADVVSPSDPSTDVNINFIRDLNEYNHIVVAGEAMSHCVADTVRDMIEYGIDPEKITLLTDAMSSVGGFEQQGEDFLNEMKNQGANFATTVDFF